MRRAFLPITLNQLLPLTQPHQRSRIPVNPPIRVTRMPVAPPPSPNPWSLVYVEREKDAKQMQEVINWQLESTGIKTDDFSECPRHD